MFEFFRDVFSSDFMPHGHCYFWRPEIVWLHVISDLLIALAYYMIPFTLVYIVRRRSDLVYPWMFLLFGIFILSCGTTHLMAVVTLWNPVYRLEGLIKALTAISSVPTAILLMRLAPAVLTIPSPAQLRREVDERRAAEEEVRRLNRELEQRVEERTRELHIVNESLRESESRLAAILNSAPAPVYLKDLEGRYTFVNRQAAAALGAPADRILGHTASEFLPSTTAATLKAHEATVVETGEALEFEEVVRHNQQDVTYLSVRFPLRDSRGATYATCGISVDITARKQAERTLKRYNEELEQFAHVASHDLQEPLRTIASYAQLLTKRYKGRLDEDADEFIGYITSGVDRMHNVILALLDYSRYAHRENRSSARTSAEEALAAAVADLSATIKAEDATITWDPLPEVAVAKEDLARVLQNLIGNAIKYRNRDKPEIHISARSEEGMCLFTVRDNGIGIAPEYHSRIFGLFRRLHGAEVPGTGIGLAITKKIVEEYGGKIWVESAPGQGSTFVFTMPCT